LTAELGGECWVPFSCGFDDGIGISRASDLVAMWMNL
jgi:hypothetical protein